MLNKVRIFIKYYLPALVWAGIIFGFSSIPGSGYSIVATKDVIIRKGAHFVEYTVLAFLVWRIFYSLYRFSARKSFWMSLILSFLYAASDELHQTLTFSRTGKFIDVIFDSISAIFVLESLVVWARKKINAKNILVIVLSLATLAGLEIFMIKEGEKTRPKEEMFELKDENESEAEKETESKEVTKEEEKNKPESFSGVIPGKVLIDVPFAVQAPFQVWDERHEEACEEASLVMVKYYLDGKKLTPEIAEQEIQSLIDFQIKKYGDYKDTTAEETVRLAMDFYGIENLRVVYDFSQEDIRKYLAEEKPAMVPAAGRLLGNPYFTPPGPLYHMLVLTGYEGNNVITNDPGTRRGKGYEYDLSVLYSAVHDLTGDKKTIEKGRKAMIIVE